MPRVNLFVATLLAAAGSAALLAQQPPGPTFKAGTQVVSLFVTVADAQKRLVPDLTKDDFEVFDNEKPQPITYFDNSIHPITVVVMLDTSGSMTLTIGLLKQAAEQFLIRLLPDDKARVGAFNDKIELSSRFTNNRDELVSDVKDLDYGNGTRLLLGRRVGEHFGEVEVVFRRGFQQVAGFARRRNQLFDVTTIG